MNKRYVIYYLALFVALVCAYSCKKLSVLQQNPNESTQAPPSTLLTGILEDMFYSPWTYAQRSSQFYCVTAEYYGDQSYDFGSGTFYYYTLRNVNQMIEESDRIGGDAMRPYYAIAHFLKAFFFINMTEQMGDVPLTQSMMAEKEIYRPKYNSQKEIYIQCFQWLAQANDSLAVLNAEGRYSIGGDIFFYGDLEKWQKLINSFRLRVLISLSHQADDPDLDIKKIFNKIITHPGQYPVMTGNDDNMQITYAADNADNYNPGYNINPLGSAKRRPLAATYINLLKKLHDPRLFKVALPTPLAIDTASKPDHTTDFHFYRGASTGTIQAALSDSATTGYFSLPNYEYWFASKTGVPTIQLGFSEVCFTIAEAINRGWTTGLNANAAAHYYKKGITASMLFYEIDSLSIVTYLQDQSVKYRGNNPQGLKQILEQKYLAFFQNSGWEAFYNQRRTGIPVFNIGPSNKNEGRIPKRWHYPNSEYFDNAVHLNEALQRQYNGADNLNGVMWLLK